MSVKQVSDTKWDVYIRDKHKGRFRKRIKAFSREEALNAEFKFRQLLGIKTPMQIEMQRSYSREWYANHKEYYKEYLKERRKLKTQTSAYSTVQNGTRSGKLIRPNKCESCAKESKTQAHHEDYKKPLAVKWLCPKCHSALHHVGGSVSAKG